MRILGNLKQTQRQRQPHFVMYYVILHNVLYVSSTHEYYMWPSHLCCLRCNTKNTLRHIPYGTRTWMLKNVIIILTKKF